ncbi:MAG: MmgE/PrpD family protein [Candidatus Rokubacteria bacterium]|nr:MmgE/PrpD family protein [Candidatus Rokubacteria bacterium]
MADYLDRLATFAADVRLGALPGSAGAAARRVLLDTLGAMIAGSAEAENRKLARLASGRGHGDVTLIGHAVKADAFWGGLTNATAGVALEVDEGNRHGGGHPAIHTIPGALAVAEERELDGAALLGAIVAGYEVGSRIGGATTARGNVHSHGTWGTISTAVAVARLGECPPAVVRDVINLAASMSPANTWTPALEGATIRNLYPGRSAWNGILAVDLQRCGFGGLRDAPSDVYGTLLAERFEPDAAVAGLEALGHGVPYRLEQNYFKFHACCRYNHFALDALAALRRAHRFDAADVTRVTVTTIPFATRMTDPGPTTMLAAKFSVPYAIAAAIVLERTDVEAFVPSALDDPRIRDLARRVTVLADPAMSPRRNDRTTAHVALTLRNGRTLTQDTTTVHGDAESPANDDELTEKFLKLTTPILGETNARHVIAAVAELDRLKDVGQLTRFLIPS